MREKASPRWRVWRMIRQDRWMRQVWPEMVDSRFREVRAADVRIRRAFRGRRAMEISSSNDVGDVNESGIARRTVNGHTG